MTSIQKITYTAGRSLQAVRTAGIKRSIHRGVASRSPVSLATARKLPGASGWQSQRNEVRRSMVMVTQTKSSELPVEEEADLSSSATTSSDASSYTVLSEDLAVTPACLARVNTLIQQRKAKSGDEAELSFLRVFVDAGGCSGFQYQFELDHEIDPDEDIVLVAMSSTPSASEPRVVVDETSLGFLHGSTLDYVQEMIKSSFVVSENPQSESACGCGSSFAVKNFASNPALD